MPGRGKFGLVVEKCLALCEWLEQRGPGVDVEAQDVMARLTLDVVLMAGFGIASNTLADPRPVPLLTELHYAMDESFRRVPWHHGIAPASLQSRHALYQEKFPVTPCIRGPQKQTLTLCTEMWKFHEI